jgi:hypothetical protein
MSRLVVALLFLAPAGALAHDRDDRPRASCSVEVSMVDAHGHLRDARRVNANTVPSVVLEGEVARRGRNTDEDDAPRLLFDVYNPRGHRYQVLLATTPRVQNAAARWPYFWWKPSPQPRATLAVAGSSITLTSMYGVWRVEPRLEGDRQACGRPEYFTIRP